MNILYINHYAGSPEMGMEFRPYYLSREWVKMGHKVSIIAGDYSHLRKNNPVISEDMQKTTKDGIDYFWLRTGSYEGNGAKRALTMLSFCRKLLKYRKWIDKNLQPDVVISSSTYPIDSIPAHRIAVKGGKRAKHVHEVHDMWPSTLIEIGGMSKLNPFVVLMQIGENYAYRNADAVVSLLKYSKDYMTVHGLSGNKFYYVPNGIVEEEWENPVPIPEHHKEMLQEIINEGKYIVGYFGGHALSNCLDSLINAARNINNDKVHFVLVGDGIEKKKLIEASKDLKNISFLPPVEKRAVPDLTKYFDCTYIGAKDSPLYRFGVSPNKMFDGMMAGKPVIFAINAPITPIEESGCGYIVSPENSSAIVKAIDNLMALTEEEVEEMGMRGRKEVESKYTYRILAKNFIDIMYK